jgi:hypothetical protein
MIHFVREALNRFRSFFSKEPLDRELDVEMASHIEMAIEQNVRRGLFLEDARRHALLQFGGVPQARERHCESRGLPWLDVLTQDLRFTFRTLRRERGFAIGRSDSCTGHWRQCCRFQRSEHTAQSFALSGSAMVGADCREKREGRRIEQNVHSGCDAGHPATEPLVSVRERILCLYRTG